MAVMPRVSLIFVVVLAALMEPLGCTKVRANPIRRVITMLQMMMKKSEDQAAVQEELFDKAMCQCKASQVALKASIETASEKIPQLEATIQELNAVIATGEANYKQAKADKAEAEKSLAEATAMRGSEAKAYAKGSTETKANIKAMVGAVKALKKGVDQGSFLQLPVTGLLQGLVAAGRPRKEYDREALSAFLQEGDQTESTPEIIGILDQMQDDMAEELEEMKNTEIAAIASFEALGAAKTKQIAATNQAISDLGQRLATAKVELQQAKADLKDTTERLEADQATYAETVADCQKRDLDYGIMKKQFADEKVALADTIKILADDQAMDMFKKTAVVDKGAAATFLQVGSSSRHSQREALKLLRDTSAEHPDQPALQLLATQVARAAKKGGSKKGFEKIMGLIDNMIQLLGKEGYDDSIKKKMCEADIAKNNDKAAVLANGIKSKGTQVANLADKLAVTKSDMAKLTADLAELDKAVGAATAQRKEENTAFSQMLSDTNQAVGILEVAKNRLKEFYPPAKFFVQTSEEIPVFLQEDESSKLWEDASASNSDEAVHRHKKPQAGGGKIVLQMIGTIQGDLKKEFASAKKEENDAQTAYEALLADAKNKREVSARAMTEKEGAKAGLQAELKKTKDNIDGLQKEAEETTDILKDLHKDCDWLLKNFVERKKLRAAEVEALNKAKSVLSSKK